MAARALPKVSDLVSGVRAATEAAATADKAHSFLQLSDGSQLQISDGKFIPGKHGVTDATPARPEPSAADRASSIEATRHHELVGVGTRGPEAAAHGGENLPPQASHEGGASHSSTTGHGDGAHGSGHDQGSGDHDAAATHETRHSPAEGSGHSSSGGHHADAASVDGSGSGGTGPGSGPWPVVDGVEGPAAGKSLMPPNARHTVSGAAYSGRNVSDVNSVILRGYGKQISQDIADIAAGKGRWDPGIDRYEINGRTYGVEPTGRVYPDSGKGIAKLDRNEYAALQQISKAKGDISAAPQLAHAPRFVNNPQAVQKAMDIYNGTYPP
jgi:hypothetical protein